ncbi:ribonuclease H-like domain-containing protein [Tanacetum coccineum]
MIKTCSKTCLKSFETLKTQLDDLRIEFNKSEFNLATYKRGLAYVEEQLVFYKKNDVLFCEQLVVLKRDISYKDSKISVLKRSEIPDKSRKGLGFEFQHPEFEGYGPKTSKSVSEDTSNEVRESPDASLVEELVSNNKLEKKTGFPTVAKINFVRPQQQEKLVRKPVKVIPHKEMQYNINSGCSRHMTGNMSYLSDFKEFDGGYVTFGGGAKGGRITGKGTLKTGKLDFEDVYFVKELQFNLFSVSQVCNKKNSVLFTNTGCFVLSPDFKLADESQVLLKVPRKNNMYSVDMKNIVPKESLTCLVAKATLDESMLWHWRLGHVNFKTINKLVKDNLVKGLPIKRFENDQTCVACLKGKQHKASPSKDETSGILKSFITQIENLVDKKVKIIRCDNGTEFKNRVMSEFCEKKGIKREFSVARTPQQNGVAERRNRTLIEAARTIVKNRLLTARSRQKSYADRRLKPLEFEVGDMVLLKVSPWKGAVHFGKRGKLSPRYIGPFKIVARVGPVAYTLELPEELKGIHSTFHVSNLKKCLAEGDVVVPMEEIQLDDKLKMIEEPVEIVDKEVAFDHLRDALSVIFALSVTQGEFIAPRFTWRSVSTRCKRYIGDFVFWDDMLKDMVALYFENHVSSPFEDSSDVGSPGVDGPPMMPEDPYAYILAAYQASPSPNYMPGPEEPQSPPPLDFVPEPMYPEYMPLEDEILPSDPEEEPKADDDEDPEEDPADYPADQDDDEEDEEPSGDDADDEDEEEDEDEDEEEEHPAPADSVLPVHRM